MSKLHFQIFLAYSQNIVPKEDINDIKLGRMRRLIDHVADISARRFDNRGCLDSRLLYSLSFCQTRFSPRYVRIISPIQGVIWLLNLLCSHILL